MRIKSVSLTNFRCFEQKIIPCNEPFVILQGKNGSGKTSFLEAIHYACYLRSFRTHVTNELIMLGHKHFLIKIVYDHHEEGDEHELTIGYSAEEGKVVKLNKKVIHSYKELIDQYRVITLTTDDISLVAGSPDKRRSFLDFSLVVQSSHFAHLLKRYRTIVDQRNSIIKRQALAQQARLTDELAIWTIKLWEESQIVQQARCTYLNALEEEVNKLIDTTGLFPEPLSIHFSYAPTKMQEISQASSEEFLRIYEARLLGQEMLWKRSLFGAHLDDFLISFHQKKARIFASRGQQKIIIFLLKMAQMIHLLEKNNLTGVLLVDDFLTDLDENRIQQCLRLLAPLQNRGIQIMVAHPLPTRSFFPQDKIFKEQLLIEF